MSCPSVVEAIVDVVLVVVVVVASVVDVVATVAGGLIEPTLQASAQKSVRALNNFSHSKQN